MAILNLNDRFLYTDGIAEKLKEIQLDLQKIPGHSVMKAFHKKLADMRHALKFIFLWDARSRGGSAAFIN